MAWFRDETDLADALPLTKKVLPPPSRVVLHGRIVTMDGSFTILHDGVIAIEDGLIVHCAERGKPLPSEFTSLKPIELKGTIYPGLFELHNHPSYNMIPLWNVPRLYECREQWRNACEYKRFVKDPAALLTHDPLSEISRAVVRFVECRALLGGVTTTQGLSIKSMNSGVRAAYAGLVRNVELPDDRSWPAAEDRIDNFTSFDQVKEIYGPLRGDMQKPFLLHLSEGVDDRSRSFFESLKAPDGSYLIGPNLVGIHGTALNKEQMKRMKDGSGIVWSPLSNLLLYGSTTDVETALQDGVRVALGSDWGPSGTKNLLGELKIAKIVSAHLGNLISDRDLVRMVTSTPAQMMSWSKFLGTVEVGKIADLLVLDGVSKDPYAQVIEARESDVVAVLINGRPRAGRATVINPLTRDVEMLRIAGQDMVLDLIDPGHPLERMSLGTAIATLSYALEHLPDLAEQFHAQHQLMGGATDGFVVELGFDEDYAMELMAGARSIGRDDVEPMVLDPISEVDDYQFRTRLKSNINIPAWLRSSL